MKVLTFSRYFPKGHPKAGQPTFFVENILKGIHKVKDGYVYGECALKLHTIRAGDRWNVGDMASLRVWSDKPYRSKQIEFAQVEVKKTWAFDLIADHISVEWFINGQQMGYYTPKTASEYRNPDLFKVAKNDGLAIEDFATWFEVHPKKKNCEFHGQIICWDESIEYCKPAGLEREVAR